MSSDKCPICDKPMVYKQTSSRDAIEIDCLMCGIYRITGPAIEPLRLLVTSTEATARKVANIMCWINENQDYTITTDNVDNLISIKTPTFHERSDKLLLAIDNLTEYVGRYVPREEKWRVYSWCVTDSELDEILTFLCDTKRITHSNEVSSSSNYKIAPNGWERLEKLRDINPESKQAFVAMWFDPIMQDIYDSTISRAILASGYKPHKVDQREHNGKIDDEIIAQIRQSKFVVADFTRHRGGVYYESGFAKGLGLEVIWTCNKDDIVDLHFDIRQYNCIVWEHDKLDDFKDKLKNRIEAVLGHGSYRENADATP